MSKQLDIGRAIAELRNRKGLSQRRLAELAGISYVALANIERGKSNPTVATLTALLEHIDGQLTIT
jgi:HTH-type transcriptional repressor of puuD